MKYIKMFDSVSDMESALASSTISVLGMAMDGNTPVVGIEVVEPTPPGPDPTTPFYIEDVSGSDNTIQMIINKQNSSASQIQNTIYKSTDGITWESAGTTSSTAVLEIVVPANSRLYLRCRPSNLKWGDGSNYNYVYDATGNYAIGGNINSLLYGDTFNGQTEFPNNIGTYVFFRLFSKGSSGTNPKLVDVSNLLLPTTTLTYGCYSRMFNKCISLTTAPALPATTLAQACYQGMFNGCTGLTTAPTLPATTLAEACYEEMFNGCTGLTTAPTLPATTLANGCYRIMFQNCTSLTTAPELPATTLATYCYVSMFSGCTNLNYIKCLATNISATSCTNLWVLNVAASGTFVKAASMSDWTTGTNGIPEGWTVQDATD